MCEDCDAVPIRYVAYFNKAGGKLWRPAQKHPTTWAIDIRPPEAAPERAFLCEPGPAPAPAPSSPMSGSDDERAALEKRNGTAR